MLAVPNLLKCAQGRRGIRLIVYTLSVVLAVPAYGQTPEDSKLFESYFPNSTEGGQALEQWLQDPDQSTYTDEQVLELVRNGLRNAGDYTTQALQQVSNRFIWNKESSPTRDKAFELMYYASFSPDGLARYYSVYSGLSLADPKSPDVLNRLVTLAMRSENTTRIIWGVQNSKQQEQFVKALEPYVNASDPVLSERAKELAKRVQEAMRYAVVVRSGTRGDIEGVTRDPNDYEGAFKDLYDTLGQKYPCFELKGIDWKAVGDEFLPLSKTVKTHEQFGLLCMELVARLEDSHAHLLPGTEQPPRAPLPEWDPGFACIEDDQGRPAVYHVDPCSPADKGGVKVGMVVLTIDDQNAVNAIDLTMSLYSRYFGYSSKRRLLYDAYRGFHRRMQRDTEIRFTTLDPEGRQREFTLKASLPTRYLPRLPVPIEGIRDSANVAFKMLEDSIGYIYVRRIRPDLPQMLDKAVGSLKEARGLIVDVRGNSGGGFEDEALFNFYLNDDHPDPNRPVYRGPMAVLIDGRCISAGEGWASWFVAKKRARFFGTATSGASARKIEYTMTNGLYKVRLPVRPYRGYLDRIIERRGIEPDVPLKQTAADLAAGRDTVLEAARDYLLELPPDHDVRVELPDDPNLTPEIDRD